MKNLLTAAVITASLFLSSCGGNQSNSQSESGTTNMSTPPSEQSEQSATSNTIEITANDQLKFSTNEIRVKAGQTVTVTLKNIGTMAKETMSHNFVLLSPGTKVEDFALKGMDSKATDYIPASYQSSVIAHTKLLGPGESDTVTFTVPAGEYEYICSFPGHYGSMRGKLIAE